MLLSLGFYFLQVSNFFILLLILNLFLLKKFNLILQVLDSNIVCQFKPFGFTFLCLFRLFNLLFKQGYLFNQFLIFLILLLQFFLMLVLGCLVSELKCLKLLIFLFEVLLIQFVRTLGYYKFLFNSFQFSLLTV